MISFRLFVSAVIIFLITSCGAIRKANRIEYLFLENYLKEQAKGNTPKTYSVSTSYSAGTVTISSSGHVHHGVGTYSIDASLIDTLNDYSYAIDDAAGILNLVRNNKNCEKYCRKYDRQKRFQRISRYTSLGAMGLGIGLLASTPDDASATQSQTRIGNMGGYLLTAGFLYWIGGGIGKSLSRRVTVMKAAYVYQFGPLPKYLPPLSKAGKLALLRNNPAFRK